MAKKVYGSSVKITGNVPERDVEDIRLLARSHGLKVEIGEPEPPAICSDEVIAVDNALDRITDSLLSDSPDLWGCDNTASKAEIRSATNEVSRWMQSLQKELDLHLRPAVVALRAAAAQQGIKVVDLK